MARCIGQQHSPVMRGTGCWRPERAAATGIAGVIDDDEIRPVYIIPGAFDTRVASAVAKAVRKFAGQ